MVAERVKVRWGVVVLVSVIGAVFTAAPFVLNAAGGGGFGDVRGLVASTLINVGTTLLLVATVFFLERGLLQRVSETAARSTARVVEERTQEFTQVAQGLATEIADLRARFADATRADEEAGTAPLRKVSDDASFDAVAEALEAANSYGALAHGTVTLAANPASDEPELIGFSWRPEKMGEVEVGWERREVAEPRMTVEYLARRNPDGGAGLPVVETVWASDQLPDEMLIALRNRMIRSGFGEEAKLVTPDLFEYLVNRPGSGGGADPAKGWRHAGTEEVSGGDEGPGVASGPGPARRPGGRDLDHRCVQQGRAAAGHQPRHVARVGQAGSDRLRGSSRGLNRSGAAAQGARGGES